MNHSHTTCSSNNEGQRHNYQIDEGVNNNNMQVNNRISIGNGGYDVEDMQIAAEALSVGIATTNASTNASTDRIAAPPNASAMGLTQLQEYMAASMRETPSARLPHQDLSRALLVDTVKDSHSQHTHGAEGATVGPDSNPNANGSTNNPSLADPEQLRAVLRSMLGRNNDAPSHNHRASGSSSSRRNRRHHRHNRRPPNATTSGTGTGSTTRLHDQIAIMMVMQNIREARRLGQQPLQQPSLQQAFLQGSAPDAEDRPLPRVISSDTRPRLTVPGVLPPQVANIVNNIMADRRPYDHLPQLNEADVVNIQEAQASLQQGLELLRQQAQQLGYTNGSGSTTASNGAHPEGGMEGVTSTAAKVAAVVASNSGSMDYESSSASSSSPTAAFARSSATSTDRVASAVEQPLPIGQKQDLISNSVGMDDHQGNNNHDDAFLQALYRMLLALKQQNLQYMASFDNLGNATTSSSSGANATSGDEERRRVVTSTVFRFTIHNPSIFEASFLPLYFPNLKNYDEFEQRLLQTFVATTSSVATAPSSSMTKTYYTHRTMRQLPSNNVATLAAQTTRPSRWWASPAVISPPESSTDASNSSAWETTNTSSSRSSDSDASTPNDNE
mgnify:CR=1 FL=1